MTAPASARYSPPTHPRSRPATLACAALVIVFVALSASAILTSSATYDETGHLPCGYAYLTRGDFRLGPEHPPLVRTLAALPLLWVRPVVSDDAERAFRAAATRYDAVWIFAHDLLYRDNAPGRLLVPARLVVTGLGALTAIVVFRFAGGAFGPAGATLAVALLCLDPSFIAHSGLVTTDVGMALFFTAALWFAWRCTEELSLGSAVATGLAVGAALASKLSALLLPPALALALLASAVVPGAWRVAGGREVRGTIAKVAVVAGFLALVGVLAWGTLWATYRFRYRAAAEPGVELPLAKVLDDVALAKARRRATERGADVDAAALAADARRAGPGLSGTVLPWAARHRLLPEAYLYGVAYAQSYGQTRGSYLLGERSIVGRASYFPIAFLVKTPLPSLVLVVAGIACALAGGTRARRAVVFLVPPVVFFFAVAVWARLNIGHRHLLPIYPPLFVLAGAAGETAWRRGRVARAAVGFAVVALAGGTLSVRPYFLTYFNAVAGGPADGDRWLVDSNLDWGQALPQLKEWMTAHDVARINLCYFGTADPAAYGIDAVSLPGNVYLDVPGVGRVGRPAEYPVVPGWVAISATSLHGLYQPESVRRFYAFLERETPVAKPGNAIFVYRVEAWPPP